MIEKNVGVKEERLYLGGWEVYRESQSGTLQLERESLHIMDDTKRITLVETLTVDSGSPVASPSEVIRYQMDNHLGSAALELDDMAATISYEEYHSFGTTSYRSGRNAAETSLKRYRYVGKERDDESGLYYYGARYYAAWLARFVSVDPLKDDYPFYTPYQYAGNKPINSVDLDGLEAVNQVDEKEVGQQAEQLEFDEGILKERAIQPLDALRVDLGPRLDIETIQRLDAIQMAREEALKELNKPLLVRPSLEWSWENRYYFWSLNSQFSDLNQRLFGWLEGPPRFYINEYAQSNYFWWGDELGGELYFELNEEGFIDLNRPRREPQIASGFNLVRLTRALRAARSTQALVRARPYLIQNAALSRLVLSGEIIRPGATIGSGTPSAALVDESKGIFKLSARTGRPETHLQKTAQFRKSLVEIYQAGNLTPFEERYIFNLYVEATEALKAAYSTGSKFPFNQLHPESLKIVQNLIKFPPL